MKLSCVRSLEPSGLQWPVFLLPKYRSFIGGDSSGKCVAEAMSYIIHTFTLQVLNRQWDISCDDSTKRITKVFINAMEQLTPRRRSDLFELPAGLHPLECFP